jgi:hypothetical protein
VHQNPLFTLLSFLNCDKYPPSLLFLLMTLGPAMVALAVHDMLPARLARPLAIFGRVPLFYYLLHIPLIHLLAVVFACARYGAAGWLFENPPSPHRGVPFPFPEGYGYGRVRHLGGRSRRAVSSVPLVWAPTAEPPKVLAQLPLSPAPAPPAGVGQQSP